MLKLGRSPSLVMGIPHEEGFIRSLKWCPITTETTPSVAKEKARLGVLAAATGSGKILIFVIPHPAVVQPTATTQGWPSMSISFTRDPENSNVIPRIGDKFPQ